MTIEEDHIMDNVRRILGERARELKSVQKADDLADADEYFIFRLGDDLFSFKMSSISEIRDEAELTPVPCTADFILGVFNLRGRILSALDLCHFVKATDVLYMKETAKLIVVDAENFTTSFLVSDVLEKVAIKHQDIKEVHGSKSSSAFITTLIPYKNENVRVINVHDILKEKELIINQS